MAVQTGTVKGCMLLKEDPSNDGLKLALITFTLPIAASADTGTLTGVTTVIANQKRNGKTITLWGASPAGQGLQGTQLVMTDTATVSGSAVNFAIHDQTGANVALPAGMSDRPAAVVVAYLES